MVHGQSGKFGFRAALAVKGIIAVEPAGAPPPGSELDALKNIPSSSSGATSVDKHDVRVRQQPASANFEGPPGNSHMAMMDTNSDEVAALVQDWMKRNNLMN